MPKRGPESGLKKMREAELSPSVSSWLKANGYRVFSEVLFQGAIDHVGLRDSDNSIVCVELKIRVYKDLITQIRRCQQVTPLTYAALPRMPIPDRERQLRDTGAGLLINGCVAWEPIDTGKTSEEVARSIRAKCRKMREGGIGGLCGKTGAIGVAVEVLARAWEFRRDNPGVTWEQTEKSVMHHYDSFLHFCSAMYSAEKAISQKPDPIGYVKDVLVRLKERDAIR